MAQAPAGTRQVPASTEAPDNRPFAVNVDVREGALDRMGADGLRGHGAAIGRRARPRRPRNQAQQTESRQSYWQYGLVLMIATLVAESVVRARVTVHDQLRSLLLSVRRRWRAEVVLRAVGRGAVLAAAPVLAGVGLAAWLAPGDGALTVLASTMGLAVLAALVMTAWRLGRDAPQPSDRALRRRARRDAHRCCPVRRRAGERRGRPGTAGVRRIFAASSSSRPSGACEAIGAAGIVTARSAATCGGGGGGWDAVLAVSVALAWPMLARASRGRLDHRLSAVDSGARSCPAMRACPPASR